MSEDNMSNISVCASCGITEVDEVKLKECADCDLVRYCSDECMQDHKSQHVEACKNRAAELHDELLFKQPESSHLGDCPICMIPLSLDLPKSIMKSCCSNVICKGCDHANMLREIEGKLAFKCPFCRAPVPTKNELDEMRMKRAEANDPAAMRQWAREQYDKGDYSSSFEWYIKAAALGNVDAHAELAYLYRKGQGVEQDEKKEIHHFEKAAIGGHPGARHNLGCREGVNGNIERSMKHFIIAATQGSDESIKVLMNAFKRGLVKKEDLAAALRAHQAVVDETKSPQREAAEEYRRKWSSVKQK
eukprot:scaffold6456_cov98-Skeletonema_dohrnii-CCMP3373.AAC.3